jgi:poly(A) polymerase
MREIWGLQPRFACRSGKRPLRLLSHPRFRAAYDFLLLRAEAGEEGMAELAEWWTHFLELDETGRQKAIRVAAKPAARRRPRRRRANRKETASDGHEDA